MIKPPIGVMPRRLWIEKRLKDLARAISDYTQAGLPINEEWLREYRDLTGSNGR